MYKLHHETSQAWVDCVLEDFDAFLVDHAACERKAGAAAEHYAVRYHDKPELIDRTLTLAEDELAHFHEVFRWLRRRDLQLGPDRQEPYVNGLLKEAHSSGQRRLLDRLLIGSITEYRGCERFALLARHLPDSGLEAAQELADFYRQLAADDSRHRSIYFELATHYFDPKDVESRLETWLDREAEVIEALPLEPRLFSGCQGTQT
jgi:tRNA-(ms[2]io[6]A)-hydroxylase